MYDFMCWANESEQGNWTSEKRVRVCDIVNSIYWVRVIHFKIYVLSYTYAHASIYPYIYLYREYTIRENMVVRQIWYCRAIVLIGVNLISASIYHIVRHSSHIFLYKICHCVYEDLSLSMIDELEAFCR